jgi:hypothetical protein
MRNRDISAEHLNHSARSRKAKFGSLAVRLPARLKISDARERESAPLTPIFEFGFSLQVAIHITRW